MNNAHSRLDGRPSLSKKDERKRERERHLCNKYACSVHCSGSLGKITLGTAVHIAQHQKMCEKTGFLFFFPTLLNSDHAHNLAKGTFQRRVLSLSRNKVTCSTRVRQTAPHAWEGRLARRTSSQTKPAQNRKHGTSRH